MAEWRTVSLSPLAANELHFGSTLSARIRALAGARRWPRLVQCGLVAGAVVAFAACSSVGSGQPVAGGTDSPSAIRGAAWVAPTRALGTEEDLAQYCGPLLAFEHNQWGRPMPPRYRDPVPGGLPSEQIAFCRSPGIQDLVAARVWAGEARDALAQMAKDMAAYYENVAYPSGSYQLCPSAGPMPKVAQAPGESSRMTCDDWNDRAGWECLQFCMDAPMWFQYELESDGQHFVAKARGQRRNYLGEVIDVHFSLRGDVVVKGGDHVLYVAPTIEEAWKSMP
jgi:hypothetical protein